MAGTIKANQLQLGDSSTATQNFTLQTNVDGTLKLARGNAGATTQDILTIDTNGKVDLLNLARSLGTTGSYTLPGGLIIKWGSGTSSGTAVGNCAVTFATAFPTTCYAVFAISGNSAGYIVSGSGSPTASSAPNLTLRNSSSQVIVSGIGFSWIAIGN